jgi:selenide,water dikinase
VEVASDILRGGAEKARQAGVVVAGGHTIQDEEPKFGLVALGFVEPARMVTKGGARPGDILVLSKPLGFGVTTTALKRQQAEPGHVEEAIRWMSALNRGAAELAVQAGVSGGSDVTGFGLLGHGFEIARASGVGLRFEYDRIPFLSGAPKYARDWVFPGGTFDNRAYFGRNVKFRSGLPEEFQLLLFDAQTSGGLLLAVPPGRVDGLMQEGGAGDVPLWVIGEVFEGDQIEVV